MTAARKVWHGSPEMRRMLVPLELLEEFPRNPRQGDVPELVRSLKRFGQVRPILTEPPGESGRRRIVAGHHLVVAAYELGWTHFAVLANDFGSEDEARAYLLADNGTAALGGFDKEALAVQLASLSDFQGTGYTEEDRQALASRLALLRDAEPPRDVAVAGHKRARPDTAVEMQMLEFDDRDTRSRFARHVAMLRREWGLDSTTDVVVRAVREAAERA